MQMYNSDYEVEYRRFSTYSINQVLGIQVYQEYLYILQPQKISVYEYYGNNEKPQLCEELILNNKIQYYSINQYYICIKSLTFIEVRDRKHWGNVVYMSPIINLRNHIISIILQGHFLYLAYIENAYLTFEKIDLQKKEVIQNINLGKSQGIDVHFFNSNKPIFLKKLGKLNDFYILGKSNQAIQLGMLYANIGKNKKKFEINEISHQNTKIHKYFHYKVNCLKYPNQSPQFIILITSNTIQQQIYLQIHQVIPKDNGLNFDKNLSSFQLMLNQFSFIGVTETIGEQSYSLIDEVLKQNMPDTTREKEENKILKMKLAKLSDYEHCVMQENKIFISSNSKLCLIQLLKEDQIQNIIKHTKKSWIIKQIKYTSKEASKKMIGVYHSHILYQENTTSYLITHIREPPEEIAQEIQEYEVNDEILQKQLLDRINKTIKIVICQKEGNQRYRKQSQTIKKESQSVQEKVQDKCLSQPVKDEQKKDKLLKLSRQMQINLNSDKSKRQFGVQTDQRVKDKIQLNQIQNAVAKYSSVVASSCIKVKQNQYIKEKIEKDISSIVDNISKKTIEPFLQHKFIQVLQTKIKEISLQIAYILQVQLQELNENMRKIQTKQNTLKGRKIFEFSNQINHMKQSVEGFMDAIKNNEINKFAFHQIIIEEVKGLKQTMIQIQTSVKEIQRKNKVFEEQISIQLGEIYDLVKVLQDKESNQFQDSVSEERMSEESLQQRDNEYQESSGESSEQQQSFQEESPKTREPSYYTTHEHLQRGYQLQKKNKSKLIQLVDSKGYSQYPPEQYHPLPPSMPYYYPFMPPTPHYGYQSYYPSINYPYHHDAEVKRSKAARKSEKPKKTTKKAK